MYTHTYTHTTPLLAGYVYCICTVRMYWLLLLTLYSTYCAKVCQVADSVQCKAAHTCTCIYTSSCWVGVYTCTCIYVHVYTPVSYTWAEVSGMVLPPCPFKFKGPKVLARCNKCCRMIQVPCPYLPHSCLKFLWCANSRIAGVSMRAVEWCKSRGHTSVAIPRSCLKLFIFL